MSETEVVHCKREKYDVYIGRDEDAFNFGNPFTHKDNTIAEVKVETAKDAVDQFENWLRGWDWKELAQRKREWILKNLSLLKNKKLGCWCKIHGHEPCHGDVLVKLVNELE